MERHEFNRHATDQEKKKLFEILNRMVRTNSARIFRTMDGQSEEKSFVWYLDRVLSIAGPIIVAAVFGIASAETAEFHGFWMNNTPVGSVSTDALAGTKASAFFIVGGGLAAIFIALRGYLNAIRSSELEAAADEIWLAEVDGSLAQAVVKLLNQEDLTSEVGRMPNGGRQLG